MKKYFFLLAAALTMMTSCSNSDEISSIDNNVTQSAGTFKFEIENDIVISPSWIEDIRKSMMDKYTFEDTWPIWVYYCKYQGKEYVFFEDALSSSIASTLDLYDVNGNKSKVSRENLELEDAKLICPVIPKD